VAVAGIAAAAAPVAIAAAVLAAIAALVIAFKKFRDHVDKTTDRLIDAQSRLAEVSGSMAAVYAEREMSEVWRDRAKGEMLSPSARYLARGEQFRKNEDAQFEVLWTRLENRVVGFANRAIGVIEGSFSNAMGIPLLNRMVELIEKGDKPQGVAEWLERIEKQNADRLNAARDRMKELAKGRPFGG
jgi:hypothetical protein